LWTIPNGALVDGVSNGIDDGTGGVIFLLGFEQGGTGDLIDESRFANNTTIAAGIALNSTTRALVGARSLQKVGADDNFVWPAALQYNLVTSGTYVTAFTLEYYWWNNANDQLRPWRIDCGSGVNNGFYFLAQGNVAVRHYTNGSFNSNGPTPNQNAWNHFAIENKVPGNSPRLLNFYVNGTLSASHNQSFAAPDVARVIDLSQNEGLGTTSTWFDEVRITKGMYRYGANFTPNPPNGGGGLPDGSGFLRS
jgi:hypothetical protein